MYSTLMVHFSLDADHARLFELADKLAERFNANVIGITATRPLAAGTADTAIPPDVIEADIAGKRARIDALEKAFRTALQARRDRLEFRSQVALDLPTDFVAQQMRSADLLVTGVNVRRSWLDPAQPPNTADLVMQAGRPVLAVPEHARIPEAGTVLVGWKDTRATRRAVADALPFLKLAQRVIVLETVSRDSELADARRGTRQVCDWLETHGVVCEPRALTAEDERVAPLTAFAEHEAADLIVAGAYGHNRLREWVLGGVTRELLQQTEHCVLFSH